MATRGRVVVADAVVAQSAIMARTETRSLMGPSCPDRSDFTPDITGCDLDISPLDSPALARGEGMYRFLLRMPEDLRQRLLSAAQAEGRSLNREIVARLEASIAPHRSQQGRGDYGMRRGYLRPAIVLGLVVVAAVLAAIGL